MNNTLTVIDINELDTVTGGEGSGQPPSTWIGSTASAVGNWMQGQSGGGALSDWGRCVQTGNPIPQGGTPQRDSSSEGSERHRFLLGDRSGQADVFDRTCQ